MLGHLGFSYIGLIFLLMLFIPNIIWTKNKPHGYTSKDENKALVFFEKLGEALTVCCALIFDDFNLRPWTSRSWWLVAAFAFMIMYELWWVRYFSGKKTLKDFYSAFIGIPLAGATLPVIAFLLLGIYGRVIWMLLAVAVLGIGHIGIHWQHSLRSKERSLLRDRCGCPDGRRDAQSDR